MKHLTENIHEQILEELENDFPTCIDCGTDLNEEELSHCHDMCFDCYDLAETAHPTPFEVYGIGGVV